MGYSNFISRHDLFQPENRLLFDDKFTINCEIFVLADLVTLSGQTGERHKVIHATKTKTFAIGIQTEIFKSYISFNYQFQVPENRVTDDLGVLWEHGRFTDVILHVQGRDIKAHKCILAARSVVFSAMFDIDMEEKQVLNPGLGQWGFFRMM